MKVDRSLFLVFTGAIAGSAVACVVKEYQPPPPPPPPPTTSAAQPGAATGQPMPNFHLGQVHPMPQPAGTATGGNLHLRPIGEQGGSSPTPTPPSPAPSACLDSGSTTAASCSSQLTSSCSGNAFPMQRCQTYVQYFDAKVAANAVSCMNNLGANACDSKHDYDCGKSALAMACPDNTVSQLCQIAAGPCKVSASDCVSMLSGLNSAGQDAVAQCVAGGCSAGLYSCIEGLGPTGVKH